MLTFISLLHYQMPICSREDWRKVPILISRSNIFPVHWSVRLQCSKWPLPWISLGAWLKSNHQEIHFSDFQISVVCCRQGFGLVVRARCAMYGVGTYYRLWILLQINALYLSGEGYWKMSIMALSTGFVWCATDPRGFLSDQREYTF